MSALRLAEGLVDLVQDKIKSALPAALDAVAALGLSPKVDLQNLKDIFVFEGPQAYQCPVAVIIVEDFDFQVQDDKSNYVNANAKVNISVVVEDQDQIACTYKAWRYQSALHKVLDGVTMVSSDNKLQLNCVVYRESFSPLYVEKENSNGFRKEVVMQCQILHTESP